VQPIHVFRPDDLNGITGNGSVSDYNIQLLAQGDSWFSIGDLPPWGTSNLFAGMGTSVTKACVVDCAHPGRKLERMTDTTWEPQFRNLLVGNLSQPWMGILLSGGGNDLIEAVQQGPNFDPPDRLLLKEDEWTNALGGERYISNMGWAKFANHITQVVASFLAFRDSSRDNKGIPVVMHTYDLATPRDVGPPGPWLYPAVTAFNIPKEDWIAVATALLARLQTLLNHIAATTPDKSLHIVNSQGTLIPASTDDGGPAADWENEIHPTKAGYDKLGALWLPTLDALFDPAHAGSR
jgi:hypothetical protein